MIARKRCELIPHHLIVSSLAQYSTLPHPISMQEAIGYCLKDMPDQMLQDGSFHPRAVQAKFYARPKEFYWRSNMSDERAEECILEYRTKNQQTGGPNFHKSGFSYGGGPGNKERLFIEPKNLMSWPVSHGRRMGWLDLVDDFLKLLCLMFEEGCYELSLLLVDKGSMRSYARMQALHKLNLNPGLAGTTHLMELAICGLPSYEEARASFLASFRAPWRLSGRMALAMDRAEMSRYVEERAIPLRLMFTPKTATLPKRILTGHGFVVDLNYGMGWDGSADILRRMDDLSIYVSAACLYEHMHLYDPHGHAAAGVVACIVRLLTSMAHMQEGREPFYYAFCNFVRRELSLQYFLDVNTGEYADHVGRMLDLSADRTCETLLSCLEVPNTSKLTQLLNCRVTIHSSVSAFTLNGLITDSLSSSAPPGLHIAIVHGKRSTNVHDCSRPLPPGMPSDMDHHFTAVWYIFDSTTWVD